MARSLPEPDFEVRRLMRCIVTGGSGFVGIALCRQLVADGHDVVIYDLGDPVAPEIAASIEFVRGDVRDREALTQASRGCDTFFHLAAMVPLTRAGKAFDEVNVGGVDNAVSACLANEVEHLVHLSSSAVYGIPKQVPVREVDPREPFGLYGNAKLEGERRAMAAREKGLPVAVIRPRTVIGPGRLGIFDLLFDWIRVGAPMFMLGSGRAPFQLVSNRDICSAMIAAASVRANGDYNCGADRYTCLREDLETLAERVGSPSRMFSVPALLARPALRTLDLLRLSPLVDWHYRTIDKAFYFDNEAPKRELPWAPVDSNVEMLEEAYAWFLENREGEGGDQHSAHRTHLSRGLLKILARGD